MLKGLWVRVHSALGKTRLLFGAWVLLSAHWLAVSSQGGLVNNHSTRMKCLGNTRVLHKNCDMC
ncbi:hypothetical protein PGT21_014749 [Puccinia graminis f. sp. tritici]|uniref:Uncharacterized protein n=1 Tax=Puccinia graminis f. sp. tritici TaxID=56615 RepID=A0A5B0PTY8_PUCGR|nr:hypothetical protein PGT21_014749 [Puccinia graminis f. sp. tritici]